jgi:hypothetical protein
MDRLPGKIERLSPRFVLPIVLAMVCNSIIGAAQTKAERGPDQQTLQALLARIDKLETRVQQLEVQSQKNAETRAACSGAPADSLASVATPPAPALASAALVAQSPPPPPPQVEPAPPEPVMSERMDVSKTLLRIRGFGDVSLNGGTQPGQTTSFALGQLDLFVTSDISDKFSFLSEIVFEGGPDQIYGTQVGAENTFGVDIERYLLQYSFNDHLNLAVGRGHTAIGYYNTAYHHSTWMQTPTDRPFVFEFEDRGGILPIHTVGVSASGTVPSGSLGLHYVAEVGNGRASRDPLNEEPVQNEIDDENHKAYNLALFARPEGMPGFQTGVSVYRDLLSPLNRPRIDETIVAGHAILIRPRFEWLNEALIDRHVERGTPLVFNTPAFYTQISKQFGAYRPYLRYQYLNVANNEPIFSDVALRHGPSAGLRYDANESVALKFQYDYTFLRNQPGVHGLTGQVGFTF